VCVNLPSMFETPRFRDQIAEVIVREASRVRLAAYENAILPYLQNLAVENEKILMERELTKAAGARRGIPDALVSTGQLTQIASRYALEDKRTVLQLSDMQKAYAATFCQIWPFCK